ncbi:integrator complex subunit 12 isoform X2 [Trichogramma pretiosum]|uniref:Integrator complex subunit 12 n=1 Tax=Trichogramma kaykai TaxID=54128 RepID=A0ABD2X3W1_9HYME|nr:integrator complex subunit 12 isoform X2 [Trichogramma pretiosum]
MTTFEMDPQYSQAIRFLHSTTKDSSEHLRILLDESIKHRYGQSKMLINVLHKKYVTDEQVLSDQSSTSSKKSRSSSSSKHSKSNKSDSPVAVIRELTPDPLATDDNLADILEDVACVVCKGMDVGAKNRLVECVKCGSLYHQECHTPAITDLQVDTHPVEWYCYNCVKPTPVLKEKVSPKSSESKSSKYVDKYKSTSNQSQNSNGNSSSVKVPNIHVVSADKRLKDMIKKAKMDKRSRSSATSKHSKSSHDKR